MSWYPDYKPTIKTTEGIKAKSRQGAFVKNWWANRWIQAMERLVDRGRLQRGRTYARQGQVLTLQEAKGHLVAEVQGSRRQPYKVQIHVQPLNEADWRRVLDALAERPLFVAQLLGGEMPAEIEDAFAAAKLSLFPQRKNDLQQSCSCPDPSALCKHLAAVHYILAERFDEDPFLLFRLRGKTQEELVGALGQEPVVQESQTAAYAPAPPLSAVLDTFYTIGPELAHFRTHITPPDPPYPVLERLGDPDFMPEARQWLLRAYSAISETAVNTAFAQANDSAENEQ